MRWSISTGGYKWKIIKYIETCLRQVFVMQTMVVPITKRYEWRAHHNETFSVCSCAVIDLVAYAGSRMR